MSFSDRIIQLKNERKLLQKDIASSVGLSLRAYQYYEKGQKEPTLSVLLRLADYFDVSLDYLVGLSDTPAWRFLTSFIKLIGSLCNLSKARDLSLRQP